MGGWGEEGVQQCFKDILNLENLFKKLFLALHLIIRWAGDFEAMGTNLITAASYIVTSFMNGPFVDLSLFGGTVGQIR